MSDIRQCPAGHLSLNAANWACPWCEVAQLQSALEQIDRETRSASHVGLLRMGSIARAALRGGGE